MQITKEYLKSIVEDINRKNVFFLDSYQRGRMSLALDLIELLVLNEEKHEQAIEY